MPLTHGGRIGFQVENVLAAAAAAWAPGHADRDAIRAGLESFAADMDRVPGRFNLLEIDGATVILDYGHNPSALARLIEAIEQFPHERRTAVYSAAGDRRDCDMIRQGELLGDAFDRVILYEDHYLRGRKPRARSSACSVAASRAACGHARSRKSAARSRRWSMPLSTVGPGEALLLQADVVDESVEFIRHYLASRLEAQEITLEETPVEPAAAVEVGDGRELAVLR